MEDFKVGDLVIYQCEENGYETDQLLALVTEIDEEIGEYTILFLDDNAGTRPLTRSSTVGEPHALWVDVYREDSSWSAGEPTVSG